MTVVKLADADHSKLWIPLRAQREIKLFRGEYDSCTKDQNDRDGVDDLLHLGNSGLRAKCHPPANADT